MKQSIKTTGPADRTSRLAPLVSLFAFTTAAALFRIKEYGLFWHLAAGRWLLEHGRIPRFDPFRFTAETPPWVDHEWLFQALVGVLERVAGLNGLIFFRVAMALALATLLLVGLRRSGARTEGAVLVVLVAILGVRPRMLLRPSLVTMFMLALLISLLQEARRADRPGGWLLAAALLVVPWANVHPGALVVPPVTGSYLLGWKLGGPRRGTRSPSWLLVLGLPTLLLALLTINPYGYQIFEIPLEIRSALEGLGAFNPEWLPLWEGSVARDSTFFFAAVITLGALVFVTARHAPPLDGGPARSVWLARLRSLDGATGLTAMVLLALAVTSIRHQTLFYMGAVFFAGECLAELRSSSAAGTGGDVMGARRDQRLGALATTLCLLALAWVVYPPSRGPLQPRRGWYHLGLGLETDRFPEDEVNALNEWTKTSKALRDTGDAGRVGPLYNNVAWGGYLLWRLFPSRKVFIDGRHEVNPLLLRELASARQSNREWDGLLDRYGIDGAIVRYEQRTLHVIEASPDPTDPPREVRRTPNALFFPRDRFALVYWDDIGMLLIRRTPERAEALRAVETRSVDPEDLAWTLRQAQADPAYRRRAIAEVRRKLRQDPDCARARLLLDSLLE